LLDKIENEIIAKDESGVCIIINEKSKNPIYLFGDSIALKRMLDVNASFDLEKEPNDNATDYLFNEFRNWQKRINKNIEERGAFGGVYKIKL
tara:strand:- start:499 stop:774 length:276 start_codon:yes stop_codon:yes gene_type:complete